MSKPANKKPSLTYAAAGVDIDRGDALVDDIGKIVKSTMRPEVLAGVGGFGDAIQSMVGLGFILRRRAGCQRAQVGVELLAVGVDDHRARLGALGQFGFIAFYYAALMNLDAARLPGFIAAAVIAVLALIRALIYLLAILIPVALI